MCGLTRPRARATAHGTQPRAARSLAHLLPPPGSSPHLLCPSPSSPLCRLLPCSLCSSSSHRFRPPPTPAASPFSVATAAVAFAANPRCHRRFPPPLCFLTTSTAASFLSFSDLRPPPLQLHRPRSATASFSITTTVDLLRLNLTTTALAFPPRPPLFSASVAYHPSLLPLRHSLSVVVIPTTSAPFPCSLSALSSFRSPNATDPTPFSPFFPTVVSPPAFPSATAAFSFLQTPWSTLPCILECSVE